MSDRNPDVCGLCGNERGKSREWGGDSNLGCPACGGDISPVVTVRNGMVHHDGRPVTMGPGSRMSPEDGSFVRPSGSGYKAGHYAEYGSHDLAIGEGKTQTAAAQEAARKAAELAGRQFVVRDKETVKRIQAERESYN